jgi:hypothetical protein
MPVDITYREDKGSKLTSLEVDENFRQLADAIDAGGLSSDLANGKVYIGNSLNQAEQQTLNKSLVGLGNVDNTSDVNKPISTATQTALDDKLDLSGSNANQDIDIGNYSLNAKHFKVNGTGGAGHIGLKHQSADITASASESSIGANSSGNPVWKNDGNALDYIELQSNKSDSYTVSSSTTYASTKALVDGLASIPTPATPTLNEVTTVGNTTTNDITVGSVTASNATVSTPTFFDSAKKIVSALGTTFGTWLNGLTAKSTPVDADVITTLDSASSFEAKKTTLLQLWSNYLLAKVQDLGYALSSDVTTVIWSTDANYTISNTTAKVLVVQQTGTFTAPRTITLSTLPAGSTLVIQGGSSITATNNISINSFVNGFSTYNNALTLAYQSLVLYSLGGGFYTTNKPQFTETTTALSSTKYLRSSSGIGLNGVTSFTPSWNAGVAEGDLNWHRSLLAILARDGSGNTIPFMPYASFEGWQCYRPGTLTYFNGQNIASGNKPTEYASALGYIYYWNRHYIARCFGEGNDNYLEVLFYINSSGVPSIVRVLQESSVFSLTLTSGTLVFAGGNAYVQIVQLPQTTTTNVRGLYNWVYQQGGTDVRFQGDLALGSSTINGNSQLELQATNKGFQPNKLTTTQRDAVSWNSTTDKGMIIYNTTTDKHQGWNGTTWNDMY